MSSGSPETRLLGIDHGARRLGLAVSDELGLMAHGLETIERKSPEQDLARLRAVIDQKQVGEIVVGLPMNMDDSLGPEAKKATAFAHWLRDETGLPVHLVDERLTSWEAEQRMIEAGLSRSERRRRVDRLAAQTILQTYLDSRREPPSKRNG